MKRSLSWLLSFFIILTLAGCASSPQPGPTTPASAASPQADAPAGQATLTLSVINVGKADAMLLSSPDGTHYMVDTGKAEDYPRLAQALAAHGVTRLEGIILTHGHKDHMGGLESLLQALPVDTLYVSALDTVTYKSGQLESLLEGRQTQLKQLRVGDTLQLGGAQATVLAPTGVDTENENNNSLVLMVQLGQTRMLLMGDAEEDVEKLLLASQQNLNAQVLKAGHHGKDDATTEAFLQAVAPEYVILTGDPTEDSESPGKRVIALLDQGTASYIQTAGDILTYDYTTDGQRFTPGQTPALQGSSPLAGLELDGIDRKAEYVRVKNNSSQTLELTGCWILSENGGETYFFPQGTTLAPAGTLTILSGDDPPQGDLVWTTDKVWKAKKGDAALLYDAQGRLLDRLD
jgi:competence protein ComEC